MLANVETLNTDEKQANSVKLAFLEEIENKVSVYHTCKKLGIDRSLVYNEWLKKDEEFKAKFNEIRFGVVEGIEGNLLSQALHDKKAITAQIFALKNLMSDKYGDRAQLGINVSYSLDGFNQDLLDKAREALRLSNAVEIGAVAEANSEPGLSQKPNSDSSSGE